MYVAIGIQLASQLANNMMCVAQCNFYRMQQLASMCKLAKINSYSYIYSHIVLIAVAMHVCFQQCSYIGPLHDKQVSLITLHFLAEAILHSCYVTHITKLTYLSKLYGATIKALYTSDCYRKVKENVYRDKGMLVNEFDFYKFAN